MPRSRISLLFLPLVLLLSLSLPRLRGGATTVSAADMARPMVRAQPARGAIAGARLSQSTTPLTLSTANCGSIPQTFTLMGTDNAIISTTYPGATLSTNAPASAISTLSLTQDVNGAPLVLSNSGMITLSAGGPSSGAQEILQQPFVRVGATNAFVTLNYPPAAPTILACQSTTAPTQGRNLAVSNFNGVDEIDCTNPNFTNYCSLFGTAGATLVPNNCQQFQNFSPPCATIPFAISRARDGDTITVTSTPTPYEIPQTIEVPIIVTIQSDANDKVVLVSQNGEPIFHVTSQGSQSQHTVIAGFILGGATSTTQPGAIQLDGDSFTEIRNNYIGQEDLPNGIGILLHNSDHPNIHDNVIHGSSIFSPVPTLQIGAVTTGFGIVTAECLGASRPSDAITVQNNLLASNTNAGLWICSDQGGGHTISTNTVRDNGRGIVLFDVVDSMVSGNFIDDNSGDGIQVVGESSNDSLTMNTIESQAGKDAAGIRLWGNGGIVYPLDTSISMNSLRRNTIDIVIAGARGTTLTGNTIEAGDYRTGVLLLVGSTLAGGTTTQPTNTVFTSNTILYNGFCTATIGCAIRLAPGVTTDINAFNDSFGFQNASYTEIHAVIYDKAQDPSLGEVFISATPQTPAAATSLPPTFATPTSTPGQEVNTGFPISTPQPTFAPQPTPQQSFTPFPNSSSPTSNFPTASPTTTPPTSNSSSSSGSSSSPSSSGSSSGSGTGTVSCFPGTMAPAGCVPSH